jgi:hypothetical protein
MGAASAAQSASATASAAAYNAAVQNRNAQITRAQASSEAQSSWLETRRKLASIRSQYGISGFQLEGSPLDVIEDSAVEGAFDVSKIRYSGELKAIGMQDEATLKKMESKSALSAGKMGVAAALIGGVNQAGSSLMKV